MPLRLQRQLRTLLLLVLALGLLTACGQPVRAPISDKQIGNTKQQSPGYSSSRVPRRGKVPKTYTVVRGDTLQAIAWRFGLNHLEIARWNKIRNANVIYVGQQLRLSAPSNRAASSRTKKIDKANPARAKANSATNNPVKWSWPAQGKVTPVSGSLGTKGIEIHGKRGSKILAAAAGEVVYSGSGLRGYGNLVIIQHNETFLSTYAHNEKLSVSEGAKVRSGQTIATMGNSGTKQVMLHFEIRRNGKAVKPINYLPRR